MSYGRIIARRPMRDKKQCDIEALERNNPRISVLRMRESSAAYRVDKVKSAVLI